MTEPNLSSAEMFERGIVTPGRYLGWQTPKTRELVRWIMQDHGLTLAEALDDWFGGL
jgi:hypothetical protein